MTKETITKIIRNNRTGFAAHQIHAEMERLREQIKEMFNALEAAQERIGCGCGGDSGLCKDCRTLDEALYSIITDGEGREC